MFIKPHTFEPQANQNLGRKHKKLEVAFQVWQSGLFDFFILYKSRLLTEKVSHQTYAARRALQTKAWGPAYGQARYLAPLLTASVSSLNGDHDSYPWNGHGRWNLRVIKWKNTWHYKMHDSLWWNLIFDANQGIWLIFYSADAKLCSRVKIWNIHWFRTTRASQNRTDAMLMNMIMALTTMIV